MPEIIIQNNQASGAFNTLAQGQVQARLGDGDLQVYIKKLDVSTKVQSSQTAGNQIPSAQFKLAMRSTPTYLIRARAEYDHHDTAAMGNWGVSLPEAHRLGMRQGIWQQMRNALLYGFNAANGEGLLNTNGATSISLPADSFGNQTALTYDNGQMALFLLKQVNQLKNRTLQTGKPTRVVLLGPQRVLTPLEYDGVVQLTNYQRPGAGTDTVKGMVDGVLSGNGDVLEWVYDDTLIGKGAGGTDAILIVLPELEIIEGGQINTNEFAKLSPHLTANTLMLCNMAAPREIPTPLAGGAIDVVSELRVTPGWAPRPEAVTIVSIQYS